jgi:hypothetical protein
MSTAEPVPPAAPRGREPAASVLAAFQLVEDARYFRTDRRTARERARQQTVRTVAHRKLARDLFAG